VRKLTFIALLAVALKPGGATLLMVPIAIRPAAYARSGEIAAKDRVSKVPAWRRLTTKRIVNVRVSTLLTAAFAQLPPFKTCALRRIPTALRTALRSLLSTVSTNPSRGRAAEEVEAKAIPALTLELRVDFRAEGLVRTVGMPRVKPVVNGNVMPNRGVPSDLIVESAEHHILIRAILHLKQTIVPLVHKTSEAIVSHLESLEHTVIVEASID
jgi:hypothetical protein